MGNRIRELRGSITLEHIADALETSPAQIHKLQEGKIRLTVDWAKKIAEVLGCNYLDILEDPDNPRAVPVVGQIAENENFTASDPSSVELVRPPPRIETSTAIRIAGDALWPVYQNGDLVFFEQAHAVNDSAIGRDCVVQVRGGPLLVRHVQRGSRPGRFRLKSYRAPDEDDVDLVWAAPIYNIIRQP